MIINRALFKSLLRAVLLTMIGASASYAQQSTTFDYSFGTFSQNPDTQCTTVEYGGVYIGQHCFTAAPTKPGAWSSEVTVKANGNTAYCLLSGYWAPISNVFYHPKYQVAGVYYAPPGAKTGSRSSVVYGASFMNGTTTNTSSSFSVSETVTLSGKTTIPIASALSYLALSNSQSLNATETSTSSESNTINTTSTSTYTLDGDTTDGIDHSQDIIRIWLNPIYIAYVTTAAVYSGGVVLDVDDPVTADTYQMDTVDVPVSVLKQLIAGASATALGFPQLNRTWDTEWTNGSPALTVADYEDVMKADPFIANPALSPVGTARFDLVTSAPVVQYNPEPTPEAVLYSMSSSSTSTLGQSATDSHSTTVSVDGEYGTVGNDVDLKFTGVWTTTNMWSTANTNGETQTATLTVFAPATADGYTGPHQFAVYKDNVYGTFVFYGIPGT